MGIHKELLAFCALEVTMRHMEEHMAEAEKAMPEQAIKVLNEIQKVICNRGTNDFEKVDEIIKVFIRNGLNSGECHDF